MKKLVILISVLSVAFVINAKAQYIGSKDVPSDISQDFASKYPNLTKVEWEKDGKHYKASFDVQNFKHYVVYDKNGNVISQEFGLPVASLPTDVFAGLKKNFPDLELKKADQIVEKGYVSYQLSLKDGTDAEEKVIMSADGEVLKTVFEEQ